MGPKTSTSKPSKAVVTPKKPSTSKSSKGVTQKKAVPVPVLTFSIQFPNNPVPASSFFIQYLMPPLRDTIDSVLIPSVLEKVTSILYPASTSRRIARDSFKLRRPRVIFDPNILFLDCGPLLNVNPTLLLPNTSGNQTPLISGINDSLEFADLRIRHKWYVLRMLGELSTNALCSNYIKYNPNKMTFEF